MGIGLATTCLLPFATRGQTPPSITTQPASISLVNGQAGTLRVSATGTSPLAYNWRKDGVPIEGAVSNTFALEYPQTWDAGAYDVVVTNVYGCQTSVVAWVTVNAAVLDGTFTGQVTPPVSSGNTARVLSFQPDGRILVGGLFRNLAGFSCTNLGRLHLNGRLDTNFTVFPNADVRAILPQADGRILIGGSFTSVSGMALSRMARISAHGTLDTAFVHNFNNPVYTLTSALDGKVVVGGDFTTFDGETRNRLCCLDAEGNLDPAFNPDANGTVYCTLTQPDGKVLVGGLFTRVGGLARTNLARLNPDGSVDGSFVPSAGNIVYTLGLQPDGKILAGGAFTNLNGQVRRYLGRLDTSGNLDPGFNPGASNTVYSVTMQTDGKILVGGAFTNLAGQHRKYLGRLNADGTPDTLFNPVANNIVNTLVVQPDGKILAGGSFTNILNEARGCLARLTGTGTAEQSLTRTGASVTWLRSGSCLEMTRTWFDMAVGQSWTNLGNGLRIPGGWTLEGLALPPQATIRARGYASAGCNNGSSVLLEVADGSPFVMRQPVSRTNTYAENAVFEVSVAGSSTLRYQWKKDGTNLVNNARVSGVNSSILSIKGVGGSDAGLYSVVISNTLGVATSSPATLTVVEPVTANGPYDRRAHAGDTVQFSTTVSGTPPVSYQWRKDGVALPGAVAASLTLSNVGWGDRGSYDLVAGNRYGNATSQVAVLTINAASIDTSLTPTPTADYAVAAFAEQPDGKILVGGSFFNLGGQSRPGLGRLNVDGSLDPAFTPLIWDRVTCLAVQTDGRILAGGQFSFTSGETRSNLARLHPDGSQDRTFNANPDGLVNCLALQPDGKILVGGLFTNVGGGFRTNLARLNADGTLDSTFAPAVDGEVRSIALQPDGRIVLGGNFTSVNTQSRPYLARLLDNGGTDPGFLPDANGTVHGLAMLSDGRILAGGCFSMLGGQACTNLGILKPDGTLDTSFTTSLSATVNTMAVQADGRIIVNGSMLSMLRTNLLCVNADGSLDEMFNPGASDSVSGLALQSDGHVWVGGAFWNLAGTSCSRFGRLKNPRSSVQSLSVENGRITWSRDGGCPEISSAIFESTTNGADWTSLGVGIRTNGGWFCMTSGHESWTSLRACGRASGGMLCGSSWPVQMIAGNPVIISQPGDKSVGAGDSFSLSFVVDGTRPMTFQWLRNGTNLVSGASLLGTDTPVLTFSNLLGGDSGLYSLVISNASGVLTSRVIQVVVADPIVSASPSNQTAGLGAAVSLSVTAKGTMPLSLQWRKDGIPLPGAVSNLLFIPAMSPAHCGNYDIIITNCLGCATSLVAVLDVKNVTIDPAFKGQADDAVYSTVPEPDGKILAGGWFQKLGGQSRSHFGRLKSDGTLDPVFAPNVNETVLSVLRQPDGAIYVGGGFTSVGGVARRNLARLHSDGSVDTAFDMPADNTVNCLSLQPDGKILVGGWFTNLGGWTRGGIARLNQDGSMDATFDAAADAYVNVLLPQADGKILVGGGFSSLAGVSRSQLGRLNADGTVDLSFNPLLNGAVNCVAQQADGRIWIGGSFTSVNDTTRYRLARLHVDGSLDETYAPILSSSVYSMSLQADGRLLIGGDFYSYENQYYNRIERLNSDGTLDAGFNPNANSTVYSTALLPDGTLLLGGTFTSLGGVNCTRIGRILTLDLATNRLSFDGTNVAWTRGGMAPEIAWCRIDSSTNGRDWNILGFGQWSAGEWKFADTGISHAAIRVTGMTAGSYRNGSSWTVESFGGLPFFTRHPSNDIVDFGQSLTLSSQIAGDSAVHVQWFHEGSPVGGDDTSLLLTNVAGHQSGDYWMTASNSFGMVTSVVARLTVRDPIATLQPAAHFLNVGDSTLIEGSVTGTPPFSFQWRKDLVPLVGATSISHILENVQAADAGRYDFVVSNAFGCTTSAVSFVNVNLASVDSGFAAEANNGVFALAVQPDGRLLAGGMFTTLGGEVRERIARLNSDGSLDAGFNPGADDSVVCLAALDDGTILAGGNFTTLGGLPRNHLARLGSDGAVDMLFNPDANNNVCALSPQPDGSILVGGAFTTIAGNVRQSLARLFADGTVDPDFAPSIGGPVLAVAVQPDNRILVGGSFTNLCGQICRGIGRLNSDGTLDTSFNAGVSDTVTSLAVQPDGKILVAGILGTLSGSPRTAIGRLNPDGTLDTSFIADADAAVYSMALQCDGSIWVAGDFTRLAGLPSAHVGRLLADGIPDPAFHIQADDSVISIALQPEGPVILGGFFSALDGAPAPCLKRLVNTGAGNASLVCGESSILWNRSGSCPELARVLVDFSADGTTWTPLGGGLRTNSGWALNGVELPSSGLVRARGFLASGAYGGSASIVEARLATQVEPPVILTGDSSFGFNGGRFGFNVHAHTGQRVVVEASPDLILWTPVVTNASGPFFFDEPISQSRFFRVRQLP
jgi:uncharacterized delta-60 repeat protein